MVLVSVFFILRIFLSLVYCQRACSHSYVFTLLAFNWILVSASENSIPTGEDSFVLQTHNPDGINPSPSQSTSALDSDVPQGEESLILHTPKTDGIKQNTLRVATSPSLPDPDGLDCEVTDSCNDPLGYEAIKILHRQLDDDANGNIDVSESDEFLRDELQYENGYERHKEFHGNDKYISVDELWQSWKTSEVHNWTVEETVEWLKESVNLPQYASNFQNTAIDGSCLPKLAINTNHYMSVHLAIKDPIHRQKISVKAMDVVLFGQIKHRNYLKDGLLVVSIIVATGGCWFAYTQHKKSHSQMIKMMKDMETLQSAEEALMMLQYELNKAKQQQEMVNIEKQDLERRLHDEMTTGKHKIVLSPDGSSDVVEQTRVQELEEMLRSAKSDLHQAEKMLESRSWVAPLRLQHWLQLTHELELRNYNMKRNNAEKQLQSAKDGCEKLRKKRSTFMGAFRIAHGSSIDDIDDSIIQAKAALCEVTSDLQERMNRWKQIEVLCGFPIVHNLGITYLENVLRGPAANGPHSNTCAGVPTLVRSSSEGTLAHEESPPPYAPGFSAGTLANIPPPSYTTQSPPYVRKEPVITVSEKPYTVGNSAPLVNPVCNASVSLDTYNTYDHFRILEQTSEDDDQLCDLDDASTERSITPPSCSSCVGSENKYGMAHGDHLSESASCGHAHELSKAGASEYQLSNSKKRAPSADHLLADTSSLNGKSDDTVRKISGGTLEKKKKSSSRFVAAFRNSFSTSNLSESEQSTELSSGGSEDKHKKKKLFFPQLKRRKTKMM